MKFENFHIAKDLKAKIDKLQEELNQVTIALNNDMKPTEDSFELRNFGSTSIDFKYLDWRGMLHKAKISLQYQILVLTEKFENIK